MTFDPNYDDEEEEEDSMDVEEGLEEESDDEYSDDDDMSWKVRRSSIKCLESLIATRRDLLLSFFSSVCPALLARFKEREENVRADVFSAFSSLLRQTRGGTSLQGNMRPGGEEPALTLLKTQLSKGDVATVTKLCLKFMTFDPNYNYDDEEEEEDSMDVEEGLEEESDDEYSDDDDMSWKVRRSSIKCLEVSDRDAAGPPAELLLLRLPRPAGPLQGARGEREGGRVQRLLLAAQTDPRGNQPAGKHEARGGGAGPHTAEDTVQFGLRQGNNLNLTRGPALFSQLTEHLTNELAKAPPVSMARTYIQCLATVSHQGGHQVETLHPSKGLTHSCGCV
ncbi:cullin-associated NEDD8-dissociated protein 1-like [Trematomus bernacchii]|uniref:cullin-associated NEDD8-dissociated protein 1-like n=1 Tax=Trematomus bernacchii TaxID=40690 RepID=UPI00146DBC85|nr:cullin-associated NEDD8-dissociated protein 1-like [Trematomus bernacchii]